MTNQLNIKQTSRWPRRRFRARHREQRVRGRLDGVGRDRLTQAGVTVRAEVRGEPAADGAGAWRQTLVTYKKTTFQVFDFIVPCVPTGLLFGRIGNYINGELWGRVSDGGYNWLTYFPQAAAFDMEQLQSNPQLQELMIEVNGQYILPRHPSQLYEAFAEGLLLFIFLWWYSSKPRPRMAASAVFLLGYGISRFIIEFFRQPDADQGFILLGWMTKGQILSAPMIIAGLIMLIYAYKRGIYDWGKQSAY